MADKQTDRQTAGRPKVLRGIILVLCLIVLALFVTLWIKLASKDIELVIQQPGTEQIAVTSEDKTARTGKWYVSLASFRLEKDAVAMVKRYRGKGC